MDLGSLIFREDMLLCFAGLRGRRTMLAVGGGERRTKGCRGRVMAGDDEIEIGFCH